ncbi:hypothetical protein ABZ299_19485 [Streptomyces sp. NPDC006184]
MYVLVVLMAAAMLGWCQKAADASPAAAFAAAPLTDHTLERQ